MYEDGYTKSRHPALFRLTASAEWILHLAAALSTCRSSVTRESTATRSHWARSKIISRPEIFRPGRSPEARNPGSRVGAGGLAMHNFNSEVDQLGDEIAVLSAHLDAATARLLDLIRQFDARGGWNSGFRSCAAWLSWGGSSRRWEHSSYRRWPPRERPCTSGPVGGTGASQWDTETFPRKRRPPWPRSRPMPWPCWRRRRCIMSSIPGPRGSATRWWSTSTPRRSPTRITLVSPSWKTARASPRTHPGAWRVTPAGW